MMIPKRGLLLLLALLIACSNTPAAPPTPTTDLAQLYLSAMQTVVAEVTLTAAAFSPTPEPTATPTLLPSPTSASGTSTIPLEFSPTPVPCNALDFDPATVDVNYPDGTMVSPGQEFTKSWRIKNVGSCTWGTGYGLIYAYGDRMNGVPQPLPKAVLPNEEVIVSVLFRAPTKAGDYVSAWRMSAPIGGPFGKPLFVKIVVP